MDLQDKIVVISGGTSGIGRAAALMLAQRGAEVLVIGRDAARGAETEAALKLASGGRGAFLQADLSLVSEGRRLVADLLARVPRIDALLLCAGVLDFEPTKTTEGLDKMFVTNFLHKLVLAEGLAALLAKGPGRLVLVAAVPQDSAAIDWTNFEGAREYAGMGALPRLHLLSLTVLQSLADDLKAAGIQVTAMNPGLSDTGIFRSATGFWRFGQYLLRPFYVPVETPAVLLCWLAFAPEANAFSGHYFPSVKNNGKHHPFRRDGATLQRVLKTARTLLAGGSR
jgi:NAD(P)-dependent dehydrogenase (short-subunit alcohol dehydrogenase family)